MFVHAAKLWGNLLCLHGNQKKGLSMEEQANGVEWKTHLFEFDCSVRLDRGPVHTFSIIMKQNSIHKMATPNNKKTRQKVCMELRCGWVAMFRSRIFH